MNVCVCACVYVLFYVFVNVSNVLLPCVVTNVWPNQQMLDLINKNTKPHANVSNILTCCQDKLYVRVTLKCHLNIFQGQ